MKQVAELKSNKQPDIRDRCRIPVRDVILKTWAESFIDHAAPLEESFRGIIGQDRALAAMTLGINVEAPGYNIYVCGDAGTGRTSTALDLLKKSRRPHKPLLDRCYVMNFKDPDRPRLLEFPAGTGVKFRSEMEQLIERLRKQVPRLFDAADYAKRKEKLSNQYERRQRTRVTDFENLLKKDGFALAQVREGQTTGRPEIMPLVRGKLMSMPDLQTLVDKGKFKEEKFQKMQEVYEGWRSRLSELLKELRKEGRELEEKFKQLDRETFSEVINEAMGDVSEKFAGHAASVAPSRPHRGQLKQPTSKKLIDYLSELKEDLTENLDIFRESEPQPGEEPAADHRERPDDPFLDYRVNVVLDNTGREQCPVVQETFPTFNNLFGAIERPFEEPGHAGAHFTSIKAGSILQADGGYLLVNAVDIITEPGVWKTLKRTLKHRQLEIQNLDVPGYSPPMALKPEPINVDIKVVMIGDEDLYRMLYFLEDDFKKIFKVKAEFDYEMQLETGNVSKYLSFIKRACKEEKIPELDRGAVAAIVEMGIRNTEDRKKISTRFSDVADLLREAGYFSRLAGRTGVVREDVEQAVREHRNRVGLDEDKLQELFERDQILVSTSGRAVGVVNGLTVFDQGDHQFGRPVRITASVALGKSGIINIERKSGLSGALYDKGVMILTGFLLERFGRYVQLNLRASVTLEQSYGGVDGDSASSTELYALLSALSGIPIDQAIGVTGSVNQKGELQPIGGASFKVEGFYDICKVRGLTGAQGVMIPKQNADNLVLRPEVEQAVSKGTFSIYAVSTIDEGIELLTGVAAGREEHGGVFQEGTINQMVMKRLHEMNALLRKTKVE
jgi:ATP-dependent Lon protease